MQNAILLKKMQDLECRVRLLEGAPLKAYGSQSAWRKMIASKPRMRKAEEARRAKILRETAGALKGKLPKDAVAWQRKIRAEWE